MDNKLTPLLIKVGMGILFLIGIVLIWFNIASGPSDDEIAMNQEFFTVEYEDMSIDSLHPTKETIQYFDYILDADSNYVIDMTNGNLYDIAKFKSSKGEEKVILDTKEVEKLVDPVLLQEYELQGATEKSIKYTMWLMIGGLALIAIFTVVNIIQNPKRFIRSAIGLVLLIGIVFICYTMSGEIAEAGTKLAQSKDATPEVIKLTGMGIGTFITLTVISIALIVVGGIVGGLRYFQK